MKRNKMSSINIVLYRQPHLISPPERKVLTVTKT